MRVTNASQAAASRMVQPWCKPLEDAPHEGHSVVQRPLEERYVEAVVQSELVTRRRGAQLLVVPDQEQLLRGGIDGGEHVRLKHLRRLLHDQHAAAERTASAELHGLSLGFFGGRNSANTLGIDFQTPDGVAGVLPPIDATGPNGEFINFYLPFFSI